MAMIRAWLVLFLVCALLPGIASGQSVVSFTLINADSDQPIAGFDPMNSGATLDLAVLPTRNLNIRANTSGTVASVRFGLDSNRNYQTDDASPFALAGDMGGNYTAWTPAIGTHSVTATPYRMTRARGPAGTAVSLSFTVVDGGAPANQPPSVNAGADQTITLPATTATLVGSASDDGLPGGTLTVAWSLVSGPGAVTFGTPSATTTTATFVTGGIYVLRLTANDTAFTASDDVTVTVNSAGTPTSVIRINAGGGAYVDGLGQTWAADAHFVGSSATFATTQPISGTSNDPLYQTERYGTSFGYQIPLPNGTYAVDLHFAEIFWTAPAQRVFDVSVEGMLALDNLDLVALAGANAATIATVVANVIDGVLNINFSAAIDNAKISAIEVRPSGSVNQIPTVNAGADQAITLPTTTATLVGSASDDGLPGGTLTVAWSLVSGPGAVTFGTPSATTTTATFSMAGVYVLRLTANDTALSASDDVTVTVNSPVATPSAIRINAGGGAYVDALGQTWAADTHFVGSSSTFGSSQPIGGTSNDPLYQTERYGTSFGYQIPLPNGTYEVNLHFAEIYWTAPGQRVFDVFVEGTLGLDNLDLVALAGANTAAVLTVVATVTDGVLNISFSAAIDNAKISAIEVSPAAPTSVIRINAGGGVYVDGLGQTWAADAHFVGPSSTFGTSQPIAGTTNDPLYQTERYGMSFGYQIPLPNGAYEVDLHFAEIFWTAPGQRVFDVFVEGTLALDNVDLVALAGANTATVSTVAANVTDGVLNINFSAAIDAAKISAIEVRPHASTGDPFLHVVIDAPQRVVDYEGAGTVAVALKGSGSHTHEIGRQLASWVWKEGNATLGTSPDIVTPLSVGAHAITLTIADDNTPPRTLAGSVNIDVFPIGAVGGALARYYPAAGTPLATLLDAPPAVPGFVEVLSTLQIPAVGGNIGGSPFSTDTLVVLTGTFHASSAGSYAFTLQGGSGTRLFVDGVPVSGPIALGTGAHALEARFAVPSAAALPASVSVQVDGGAPAILTKTNTTHDQSSLPPFITALSGSSGPTGGGTISLQGLGFFPKGSVTVVWNGTVLSEPGIVVGSDAISFPAPAGTGTVSVAVQTPNGLSNAVSFTYLVGGPIGFASQVVATPASPTQGAWGPDGRLYVGTITGQIHAYTFDGNYAVSNVQTIASIGNLGNSNILGIAFNPFDPPSPVKVYVAHSQLFANGGSCFMGSSAYTGQVSVLTGPGFSTIQPLVTGLPTSNHDHGINGMAFDDEGDLLIAVGGNTNAGIEDCNMGGLPESPLSGAILKARISKPGFNGAVHYVETVSGVSNANQTSGHLVDVAAAVDVGVFSAGLRNPFDLVWTTLGALYGTDNGANSTFGPASTSATTQTPVADAPDEILSLIEGHYYGHPNRNRGRRDARQNTYRAPSTASILGLYTAPLATVPPSTNGIDEYRSTAFGGALRGNLLVQNWNGALYRAAIAGDGSVATLDTVPGVSTALDVLTGPGGAIIGIDYTGNAVKVAQPQGASGGMQAYDIFPWRARPDTSAPFVIGGTGFGSGTSVTIGGLPATITTVTPTRIHGLVPTSASPTPQLLDVVVQSAGVTSVIPQAFRYVLPRGLGKGAWQAGTQLPAALGEVAGGAVNGVLYLVGHDSSATLAYDPAQNAWNSSLPQRPLQGNHHAAEVIDGKLYLFGGIGGGSEGTVQIFDPFTQSWTLGANIPFATGSASTALIGGKVYLAGGIVGSTTTSAAAVYNPATNTWASIASMPLGRNHAASATDGQRLFIFGGRGPGSGDGNVVAEGFGDVQIYNPATDEWVSSADPGSASAPLPQKRGGMGKAAFFGGEFYVIGGETTPSGTGQVAGNVYTRVDVYNPVLNTWRLESALPTARHGIFPLAFDGKIFVGGGGTQAGHSASNVLEVFSR